MEHVRAQLCRLNEALIAHPANVWAFASMDLVVAIQGLFGRKAFATLLMIIYWNFIFSCHSGRKGSWKVVAYRLAGVRFFAGVHTPVLPQSSIGRERFVAQIAWKWFFASVGSYVDANTGGKEYI